MTFWEGGGTNEAVWNGTCTLYPPKPLKRPKDWYVWENNINKYRKKKGKYDESKSSDDEKNKLILSEIY